MKIYVTHSKSFDFKKELYEPIRRSNLNEKYTFILPHEKSNEPFNSKDYLRNEANLCVAEISQPALGLGIEIGWADIYKVPIVFAYKKGSKLSKSIEVISKKFIEYSTSEELVSGIENMINRIQETNNN